MAKAAMKNRIKKMNFQKQEREMNVTPLSDNDKYILVKRSLAIVLLNPLPIFILFCHAFQEGLQLQ